MKRKLKQYQIFKISTNRLIQRRDNKICKVVPITLSKREALENGEMVMIQQNQLTNKIFNYFKENNIPYSKLSEIIVNIVVPTDLKKQGEKDYSIIAKQGFILNNKRYVRLYSGSGQLRRNTVTFIREDLYEPIFSSLLCGLTLDDFGKEFNAAKFNAYCGLNMSGCHLLTEALTPKVCVVDDFEQIRPHNTVNYVTEDTVKYITLPDEDYILCEGQTEYQINGNTATRNSDGTTFTVRTGVKKYIQELPYDEIENSPPLNSFDGQGLMSPEWAERVSLFFRLDYIPSEIIIRAPWVKGLLATVPFHEWFAQHNITEITDSFGKVRQISEVDCIISKSQFKMWKIYKTKCNSMGVNAWDYYCEAMQENHLCWGITKFNSYADDDIKALNYQYLQALQLENEDIEKLCKPTKNFLQSLNSGNIDEIYKKLMITAKDYKPIRLDDENEVDEFITNESYAKLFQKVLETNPKFIDDKYIRELILNECQTKFDSAKLGKILARGNFQFCVSDPVAQMEWIAKNHCGLDIDVVGVVPNGKVYSNYWLRAEDCGKEIVLMRSPLIDRNEIAKRGLIQNHEHYFRYLGSGIIYSINDLTALQMGGSDFDGDICYSTNDPIILKGCYDYAIAKPLYYILTSTDLLGKITATNVIDADVRGLNSKVGQISNKAGSLYAKLYDYAEGTPEYKKIYNSIIFLGQVVGQEIDRIKTAVAPKYPLEWKPLQGIKRVDYKNGEFEESQITTEKEQQGIFRHNKLTPDIKPYFFRYNYTYIDKSLKELHKVYETMCKRTLNYKLDELISRVKSGNAKERELHLYDQYISIYPVVDTDCIVNHICHYFEDFEKGLKRKTLSEGTNMLTAFVDKSFTCDKDMLNKVKYILDSYKRHRRLITKNANTNQNINNKQKVYNVYTLQKIVSKYYRNEIFNLSDGDLQRAFNYVMVAAGSDEKVVWHILDETILPIIRKRRIS